LNNDITGYYFITDEGLSRAGYIKDAKSAIRAGVKIVQYRNKTAQTGQMCREALEIKKICKNTLFLVNDRVDVALVSGADGVHIGQEDMPLPAARKLLGRDKIIGVTVGSVSQAKKALAHGADYLGVAPIFQTGTKKDAGQPVGITLIKQIKKISKVPIVAIGGITLDNAKEVINAGADSVCAISCVVTKKDVAAEILKFQRLFEQQRRS
jgi:thiamine-phosphate pyrophosphorylase